MCQAQKQRYLFHSLVCENTSSVSCISTIKTWYHSKIQEKNGLCDPCDHVEKEDSKPVIHYRECYICIFHAIATYLLYNFEDHIRKIPRNHWTLIWDCPCSIPIKVRRKSSWISNEITELKLKLSNFLLYQAIEFVI